MEKFVVPFVGEAGILVNLQILEEGNGAWERATGFGCRNRGAK